MRFWSATAALIIICFLLGWDLGLHIANRQLKIEVQEYKMKVEYIEEAASAGYNTICLQDIMLNKEEGRDN